MALVNLKSFAIKNAVSLGFNLILARKIETKEIRLLKKFTPEQLLSYSRREVGELKAYISELEWKINKLEESNKALQHSSMFARGNCSACIVKNGLAKISDKTIKRLSNELSPEERKEFRRSVKREELYRSQKEWIKKFKERINNLEEENAALRLKNADL